MKNIREKVRKRYHERDDKEKSKQYYEINKYTLQEEKNRNLYRKLSDEKKKKEDNI